MFCAWYGTFITALPSFSHRSIAISEDLPAPAPSTLNPKHQTPACSIAIFGTGVAVITYYNMLNKFEMRVRKAVSARLQKYKTSLGRAMPTHVVNVLFNRSIDRALAENGLSFPRIISKVLNPKTLNPKPETHKLDPGIEWPVFP
jgi:hypothetical protein